MTFRRIDDSTVNCIITPEDMRERGLQIDDLFEKKKEAMEFLHAIVSEAVREVGFHPQGAVTSMQIAVLPDRSVSLTLSEKTSEAFRSLMGKLRDKLGIQFPQELLSELDALSDDERVERLKEYAAAQQKAGKARASHADETPKLPAALQKAIRSEDFKKMAAKKAQQLKKEAAAQSGKKRPASDKTSSAKKAASKTVQNAAAGQRAKGRPVEKQEALERGMERPESEYVFSFATFRAAADCCRQWTGGGKVSSALYYQPKDGRYYLVFGKNDKADDEFEKTVLHANEFGTLIAARPEYTAYLKEHAECLWDKDAIETLAKV